MVFRGTTGYLGHWAGAGSIIEWSLAEECRNDLLQDSQSRMTFTEA